MVRWMEDILHHLLYFLGYRVHKVGQDVLHPQALNPKSTPTVMRYGLAWFCFSRVFIIFCMTLLVYPTTTDVKVCRFLIVSCRIPLYLGVTFLQIRVGSEVLRAWSSGMVYVEPKITHISNSPSWLSHTNCN